MRTNHFKTTTLNPAVRVLSSLLFAAVAAFGQQQINLTAGAANASMPDGTTVPMWGYTCAGTTVIASSTATCAKLNPAATGWSPVVITVPTGATGGLQINLTNSLSFANGNTVPTSIMIVGQVGGGLGSARTTTASPTHPAQQVTWAVASSGPTNVPPPQGQRVQSLATEVAAGTTATALTWSFLKPGTYLLESGTHPSIQGPMGLYGILVVTAAPTASGTAPATTETAAGCAYYAPGSTTTCAVPYDAEVPLLLSEIDPVQNTTVSQAVNTAGFSETAVWSGQPGGCGNPTSGAAYLTCYPPAVNYTPLYYMINGVPFNKNNTSGSLFSVTPATIAPVAATTSATGNVLVRVVNAGLRMHVPAIVGSQVAGATGGSNPIVTGFKVIAEDGNPLPGVPKIKSEVFMAAGKVYDLMINGQSTSGTTIAPYANALAVYDRELSLSANATARDSGMLAYVGINGNLPAVASGTTATPVAAAAVNDTYSLVPGQILTVADQSRGVIANDRGVYTVQLLKAPTSGTVTLNTNGTFVYYPNTTLGSTITTDSFTYCANGQVTGTTCSSGVTATVTLGPSTVTDTAGITCTATAYTSTMATYLAVKTPGILAGCKDGANLPLSVATSTVTPSAGLTVVADSEGGFTASASGAGTYTFTFQAQTSQAKSTATTVTVVFPAGSGLTVKVLDGYDKTTPITDYRWIIEEDRTFYIDPNCQTNPPAAGCPTFGSGYVPTLGVNFHTSYMPFVAQGCTGAVSCESGQTVLGQAAACDVGDGVCRTTASQKTVVMPGAVALDPTKRYYISILPGDAATPFISGYAGAPNCSASTTLTAGPNTGKSYANCGHGMGGAPIAPAQATVTVMTQPSPYPPAKLSVFVFEDDFPLNGEQDGGGGIDVLSPQEPGLGGFQIHLWDAMGGNGDFTGQMTYDMFNQPLSNGLAGTKDPNNGLDACPISAAAFGSRTASDPTQTGITGMIVTCPKYESDGVTLSPLAGQAVVYNLMPGRWGVVATPGADRIARGEEWLQTNTLDGQKAHDSFTRIGEPSYFQEFGPASYHVSIGFANPGIINDRHAYVCNGTDPNISGLNCNNTLTGKVTGEHLSRTPDERLFSTGSHDTYYWTQCYISFGDPDGEDFAFTKCRDDGTFTLTGLPDGNWRVTVFDQWNDLLVDGLSTPIALSKGGTGGTTDMGEIASTQWETNLYTRTFIDDNKDGIAQGNENGIPFANVAVRLRDGSLENLLVTDFHGTANFNETFPLFSWYVVETDTTRYKNTGTHVVYDVGGPVDGSSSCGTTGYPPCGNSTIGKNLASTAEVVSVPANLRVPGAVYCAGADCTGKSIQNGSISSDPPSSCTTSTATPPITTCSTQLSSGRIDPPWFGVEGWQGFPGQNNFLEFGKEPYAAGENGGIKGHVVYASTRPFDDPMMLVQTQWTPLVPHVTINLYQEGFASDGVTPTLTKVDTTQTSSFDEWAQGFRSDGVPYMNCPGQGGSSGVIPDLFMYSLYNQPNYLDFYASQHGGPALTPLPLNSQFKCYDGMHNWNQIQPAPYDGMYQFPSVNSRNTTTGAPVATSVGISAISEKGNIVTVTTATTHGLISGSVVTIAGASVAAYNGSFPISVTGPTTFTYSNPATLLAAATTGTVTAAASNCTICSPNHAVPSSDLYYGLPMLPTGKYVVEVVLPPGFELVKEEDKNILIGDNFIAPATQQFGGLGNMFIIPDQASVAGSVGIGSGYNANNAQNPTQSLGATPEAGIVPAFIPEPIWPCVGEARIVPDYISLYPQSKQVAPFAGATRKMCDRKEVTLGDQMGAIAKFYIYTSTHIASKFTGGITDDFTSEFDPFSPQFGEKFAPPNLPVSVKDWAGNEISRVYADHWGTYNGMTYSTWEVNPPNPTGYSPTMMVFCMNDPGPIPGPGGTMITDPAYSTGYSQFCYELPFMPGTTQYLDTPVVPTSAFAGAGYNNVDCAYPSLTPAISEVDGDQVGPWVSAAGAGHTLTITSLGDQSVPNYAYSGPAATTAPFNQRFITRHYGFGNALGTVAIVGPDGVPHPLTGVSWSDTKITGTVPTGVPNCAVQQQSQYRDRSPGAPAPANATAKCGQLVITAASGQQSIDTVTVTIGGRAPTHVAASGSIQTAIDQAAPGDLIIVDPTCPSTCVTDVATTTTVNGVTTTTTSNSNAAHSELLLMWKPVRLQGVGAASSAINANTHPAGKLDAWRQRVNCLFGLNLNGTPITTGNPYDPTGATTCPWTSATDAVNYFVETPNNAQVDPLPAEAVFGWDATLNGNLAQLLQEPSLMGALEGAGITVLAKGVNFSASTVGQAEGTFPPGTTLLTGPVTAAGAYRYGTGDTNPLCHTDSTSAGTANPFPSNFMCNPSSIDGLSITDSSQGGGGIFVHAWAHNLQIANNRINSNAGTLAGGINLGQGEFAPEQIQGATLLDPGSCVTDNSIPANAQLPYCANLNVNIHNNNVSLNSSIGDELFSATPAGAGGVSLCSGSDYYKFNYNWICGNLSSGDGGGVGHLGFSYNGQIQHNSILFNQSLNPTIPANGGGLVVMGTPDIAPPCSDPTDKDCVSAPGTVLPSDGAGPGLVVNANLIMGNAAEAGSGGGLRLQNVNGADVLAFPTTPSQWYSPTITNNIIADNVAGWDGAGISLVDTLNANIINNTVVSNSTTASAGILFTTIGAPLASSEGNNCTTSSTTSCPQISGLVSIQNSAVLEANLPTSITCPANHYQGTTATNGTCRTVSYPLLENNIFWQNSAYYIGVGALSAQYQQNVISLYNAFTTTLAPTQSTTGQCVAANYWDIGVRGDLGPGTHDSGVTLNPIYSVISTGGYGGTNSTSNPSFVSQYCDGARTPPEFGASGWFVPAGISDATVPNPIFNLTPVATVDEGNNWINLRWGPLSLIGPAGTALGNYALAAGSPIINLIPTATDPNYATLVPRTDFFGNPRPDPGNTTHIDPGAVEFAVVAGPAVLTVVPTSLTFSAQPVGTTSPSQTLTLTNSGGAAATGISENIPGGSPFSRPGGAAGGTCAGTLAAGATCTINVVFAPTATGTVTSTLTVNASVAVAGSPVSLSGTGTTATRTFSVTPSSLSFGNWPTSFLGLFPSTAQTLTVTNTGNLALAGGTYTFSTTGTGTGTPFRRPLLSPGTCGATLAVGASCTYNVVFAPTVTGNFTRTLAVAFTGAVGTGTPVALSGTGVNMAVNPASLAFGAIGAGSTSGAQTLTVSNQTGSTRSLAIVISAGAFTRPAGTAGGTCAATLANGATCTINVVFTPPTASGSPYTGTATITTNGGFTVANSPVSLSGNGVPVVAAAALTPVSWSPTASGGCGLACPVTQFTLTNTGNVTLTGITQATIAAGSATEFSVVPLFSTCGPAVGGQLVATTSLAPGASCVIEGRFAPPAGDSLGSKSGTLTITAGTAGAQTSALTGTVQ